MNDIILETNMIRLIFATIICFSFTSNGEPTPTPFTSPLETPIATPSPLPYPISTVTPSPAPLPVLTATPTVTPTVTPTALLVLTLAPTNIILAGLAAQDSQAVPAVLVVLSVLAIGLSAYLALKTRLC